MAGEGGGEEERENNLELCGGCVLRDFPMKKYFQGKKLQTATSLPSCSNSIQLSSPSTPPSPLPPGRSGGGVGGQKGKSSGFKLSPQRSAWGNAIARTASLTTTTSLTTKKSSKQNSSEKNLTPKKSSQVRQHSSLGSTELLRVFEVFDADGDGQISQTELGFVLRSLGDDPTELDLQSIIEYADTDGDGFISLEEFITFNQSSTEASSPTTSTANDDAGNDGRSPEGCRTSIEEEECVKAAFRTFDKDGNGFISATELHGVLLGMGDEAHSLEDCCHMISSFDKDGDGFVDYQEFRSLLGVR